MYAVAGDFRVGELLVGSATTITTGNVDFVTSAYYLKGPLIMIKMKNRE